MTAGLQADRDNVSVAVMRVAGALVFAAAELQEDPDIVHGATRPNEVQGAARCFRFKYIRL